MTRLEKILVHGGTLATGVTGLAYAAFKHLMTSDDPFTAYNHPLQPWMLTLHVLAAPVLVFGVGIIFKDHVLGKMKNGAPPGARRGGLWTLALVLPLILTGYIVQVLASGNFRNISAWIHLGLGIAFLALYGIHLAGAFKLKAEKERRAKALPLEPAGGAPALLRGGTAALRTTSATLPPARAALLESSGTSHRGRVALRESSGTSHRGRAALRAGRIPAP